MAKRVRMKAWTVCHGRTSLEPVIPFDCNPGSEDEGMLVYRSEEAAASAARHQAESYDLVCRAVPLEDVLVTEIVPQAKAKKKGKVKRGK